MARGSKSDADRQGGAGNRESVSKQEVVQATRTGKDNKNGKSEVGRSGGNK